AHDHRLDDLALGDLAAGGRFLDAADDHVADARVAAAGSPEHADAQDAPGARVVRHVEYCLLADHFCSSTSPKSAVASCTACSITRLSLQRLWRLSGRVSAISTRSPGRHWLFSSCTM